MRMRIALSIVLGAALGLSPLRNSRLADFLIIITGG